MRKRNIEFTSVNATVRGTLVLPEGGRDKPPVVIMGGGWCYVKEIVLPHYAEGLLAAGCAVLMFDYRYLGASGGEPRQHIDPWQQIEDYRNAISFAATLPDIDPNRIGIWGISYAGGHVLITGAIDPRVKCIVSNIPVVDGFENMRRVHGTTRFNDLQVALLEDRIARASGKPSGRMAFSTLEPHKELSTWPFPLIHKVFHDIKAKEAPLHEHWSTAESTELLLNYTVFPFTRRITNTPTLMVVAEGDEITLWDLEIEAFHSIPSPRKQLAVIPKVSHMSLYAEKSHLQMAGEAASAFVRRYLVE